MSQLLYTCEKTWHVLLMQHVHKILINSGSMSANYTEVQFSWDSSKEKKIKNTLKNFTGTVKKHTCIHVYCISTIRFILKQINYNYIKLLKVRSFTKEIIFTSTGSCFFFHRHKRHWKPSLRLVPVTKVTCSSCLLMPRGLGVPSERSQMPWKRYDISRYRLLEYRMVR